MPRRFLSEAKSTTVQFQSMNLREHFDMLEIVVAVCSLLVLFYYAYSPFKFWTKRGVLQVDVKYPLIGNTLDTFYKNVSKISQKIYYDFPNERFVGTYRVHQPSLFIRDPELAEAVLIKDFSSLSNRASSDNPNSGKLLKHLLNVEGEHWKTLRNKLTPTFSSGKLKDMHSQLIGCGESLLKYMKNLDDGHSFEVRDVISRFTMDVIASCAFGLNIDTINDPDSEFRKMGLEIFKPSVLTKLIFVFRRWARPLVRALRINTGTRKYQNFFIKAVDDTLEYREKNNITRQDFLHLMNELRKKDLQMVENKLMAGDDPYLFDHSTLVSNAFVFFLAGFETTATTVSYAMYELALNQDVQEHLYKEVSNVLKKYDGVASFNAVNEMVYLDQVISETLRKYPPAVEIGRKVVKEYRVPGTDLVLPVGTNVTVPLFCFHHDPQYFPEPEKFRPDRFDEGMNSIHKGTYMPFGAGPRICIGARFAKLEAKVCLSMIVNNYKMLKCDKTVEPLTFDPNAFLLVPKGGLWLAVEPRKLVSHSEK